MAKYKEAEELFRKVLSKDEASLGPDHPDVARDLNNLAQLLKATNRFSEVEPLMRRGLEIEEKSKGKNHPHLAIQLNNLAGFLRATNRPSEARRCIAGPWLSMKNPSAKTTQT